MDYQNYLKQYDESHSSRDLQKVDSPSRQIEDGTYQVKIVQMTITQSKTKGLPQLVWKFEITEGTYKGRTVWKVSGLDTFEKIGYLKKELAFAGLNLRLMANLSKEIDQLINQHLEVTIKNKDKWQNVYIKKRVSPSSLYQNNVEFPF